MQLDSYDAFRNLFKSGLKTLMLYFVLATIIGGYARGGEFEFLNVIKALTLILLVQVFYPF